MTKRSEQSIIRRLDALDNELLYVRDPDEMARRRAESSDLEDQLREIKLEEAKPGQMALKLEGGQ